VLTTGGAAGVSAQAESSVRMRVPLTANIANDLEVTRYFIKTFKETPIVYSAGAVLAYTF
jgi:hypothetical protein